ncbi:MAG: ATP-binding protein [Chitinophagaceae bacterium]
MDTNETKIYTAILVAAIVLGIILVYFIITIIRHQKSNLALYKEKMQVEINTLEKERKRIASDLHDELGPHLSSVRLQINCIHVTDPDDAAIVEKAVLHIDSILNRLREISNDLMPNVLLRKGLVTAIREFVDKLNEVQPLRISYNVNEIVLFTQETEIHLYRIVQELIHNTLRHAKAQTLDISIDMVNSKLILKTTDNGQGFDSNIGRQGRGFGLSSIMSRVELLHGDVYLDSAPGKGTAYTIEIPLQKTNTV